MQELVDVEIRGLNSFQSRGTNKSLKVLFFVNTNVVPMGLAYISAVLKRAGHQTFGINGEYEPFKNDYVLNKLKEIKPDMVFLSIMYTLLEDTYTQIADW